MNVLGYGRANGKRMENDMHGVMGIRGPIIEDQMENGMANEMDNTRLDSRL